MLPTPDSLPIQNMCIQITITWLKFTQVTRAFVTINIVLGLKEGRPGMRAKRADFVPICHADEPVQRLHLLSCFCEPVRWNTGAGTPVWVLFMRAESLHFQYQINIDPMLQCTLEGESVASVGWLFFQHR